MRDRFNRTVRYLRLSLTRACQMRCMYCRPTVQAGACGPQLTPEEMGAIVAHLVERHGLRKVRLTGGDPSARPDLIQIIEAVASAANLADLAMTTNGLTLAARARQYASAGLRRVNVSLDTLDPARFAAMTGVDALDRVVRGIDAALDAGLTPLKLNTVVIKSQNERDLPSLVDFAARRSVAIRFIELMPMGPLAGQWAQRYVPMSAMRRRLADTVALWRPLPHDADSSRNFRAILHDGREVTIGFITPMSCTFCAACDRLRIASDGGIYPCLMDEPRGSIWPAVRPTFDPQRLDRILSDALALKAPEHPQVGVVTMTSIGG